MAGSKYSQHQECGHSKGGLGTNQLKLYSSMSNIHGFRFNHLEPSGFGQPHPYGNASHSTCSLSLFYCGLHSNVNFFFHVCAIVLAFPAPLNLHSKLYCSFAV